MINKITIKNGVKIIDNDYVYKKKKENINNVYNYLLSRSFDYFPEIIKEDNDYIYYKYIEDIEEPKEQKMIDLINLLSLLHNKTTFYKEIDIDHYKYIFESTNELIDDTYKYYNELMDNIDSEVYMSPSDYLIARNITIIYSALNYAKENISLWYKLIENKRKVRVVTVHNNLSLDHYRKRDKPYFISWDKTIIDIPIYDLINLYKKHYLDFDFTDLLKIYLSKYPLSKEEIILFLTIISIPNKIEYSNSIYKAVLNIRRELDYIYKTKELVKTYQVEINLKESES